MKQANQISPLSSSSQCVPMGFAPAANKVVPAAARPPTTRAAITHIIFDMDSLLSGLALGIGERGGRLGPMSWGGDNFFFCFHTRRWAWACLLIFFREQQQGSRPASEGDSGREINSRDSSRGTAPLPCSFLLSQSAGCVRAARAAAPALLPSAYRVQLELYSTATDRDPACLLSWPAAAAVLLSPLPRRNTATEAVF
jgi:hypothetical protein